MGFQIPPFIQVAEEVILRHDTGYHVPISNVKSDVVHKILKAIHLLYPLGSIRIPQYTERLHCITSLYRNSHRRQHVIQWNVLPRVLYIDRLINTEQNNITHTLTLSKQSQLYCDRNNLVNCPCGDGLTEWKYLQSHRHLLPYIGKGVIFKLV